MDAAGFITAGGLSSRMGRDKGLIELDGRSLIEHVIGAFSGIVTDLSIIANSSEYDRFGLPVFGDMNRGVGPLEAIRTALANSATRCVLLSACDTPFVTRELFEFLLRQIGEYNVVVPRDQQGMLEPLCAVYSREVFGPVSELIASGRRKVSDLFERVPTRTISFEEFSHLSGAANFFKNINTPDDLESAAGILAHLRSFRSEQSPTE